MLQFLKNAMNRTLTENGAVTLRTSGSDCLDLFASIGALRGQPDAEIADRFLRHNIAGRPLKQPFSGIAPAKDGFRKGALFNLINAPLSTF